MGEYYIVPGVVVNEYQNSVKGDAALFFMPDVYGRYVVNTGVEKDWPEIAWGSFEIVTLSMEDFPQEEL